MKLYNRENKKKVDDWLADPAFRAIVEKDLGTPIKVKVIWEKGIIQFRGPLSGRELQIRDILDAYGAQHLN